jgi:hypothetical protein
MALRAYCMRGLEDDWRRCLVCGICWLANGDIAVNNRQLRAVLRKSKSSLNSAFAMMHYGPDSGEKIASLALRQAIPYLTREPAALRQWRIRRMGRSVTDRHETPPNVAAAEFCSDAVDEWSDDVEECQGEMERFII